MDYRFRAELWVHTGEAAWHFVTLPVEIADEIDAKIGLKQLKAIHLNDSRDDRGSNRDRHAPLGKGEIGRKGLRAFLGEPRLDGVPTVLEGPGIDGHDVAIAFDDVFENYAAHG